MKPVMLNQLLLGLCLLSTSALISAAPLWSPTGDDVPANVLTQSNATGKSLTAVELNYSYISQLKVGESMDVRLENTAFSYTITDVTPSGTGDTSYTARLTRGSKNPREKYGLVLTVGSGEVYGQIESPLGVYSLRSEEAGAVVGTEAAIYPSLTNSYSHSDVVHSSLSMSEEVRLEMPPEWDWRTASDTHLRGMAYVNVFVLAVEETTDTYINHVFAVANQILAYSEVYIQLQVVGRYTLPADIAERSVDRESGSFDVLEEMIRSNDGGIRNLIYESGADLTMGFAPELRGADGRAILNGSRGSLARDGADMFSVVIPKASPRTVVHEIGHNLGLMHSRRQNEAGLPWGGGSFPFALGHGVDNAFVTIMAYPQEFTAPIRTVPRFSSPHLDCGRQPCGVSRFVSDSDSADAVFALNAVRFDAENLVPREPPLDLLETLTAKLANPGLQSCLESYIELEGLRYTGQIGNFSCADLELEHLSGIELFPNLRSVTISWPTKLDIAAIAELESLIFFSVRGDFAGFGGGDLPVFVGDTEVDTDTFATEMDDVSGLFDLPKLNEVWIEGVVGIPCWQLDHLQAIDILIVRPETCDPSQDGEDFDGDGVANQVEVERGSNPARAETTSVFQFKFSEYTSLETEESINLTILRNQGQERFANVRVRATQMPGTANDEVLFERVVDFAEYQNEHQLVVPIATLGEAKTISLTLSDPSVGTLAEDADSASITIIDNDYGIKTVGWSSERKRIKEPGRTGIDVRVQKFDDRGDFTVEVLANSGTAVSGADFMLETQRLEFTEGDTVKTVYVDILADRQRGEQTWFELQLLNANGAIIDSDRSTIKVVVPDLQETAASKDEQPSSGGGSGSGAIGPLFLVCILLLTLGSRHAVVLLSLAGGVKKATSSPLQDDD